MHVFLLLAVVGSTVAAPQTFSRSFSPTSFSAPTQPTIGFAAPPPQSFGFPAAANSFARQDSTPFAPRPTNFHNTPFTGVPGNRVFNLDSTAFAPSEVQPLRNFDQASRPTYQVISRDEYLNDNGEYSSSFKGSDGSKFSETGSLRPTNDGKDNVVVKVGSFEYTSPEGVPVVVTYTADEYGFHPVSNSIPQQVQPLTPTF